MQSVSQFLICSSMWVRRIIPGCRTTSKRRAAWEPRGVSIRTLTCRCSREPVGSSSPIRKPLRRTGQRFSHRRAAKSISNSTIWSPMPDLPSIPCMMSNVQVLACSNSGSYSRRIRRNPSRRWRARCLSACAVSGSTVYLYTLSGEHVTAWEEAFILALPLTGFSLIQDAGGGVNEQARRKLLEAQDKQGAMHVPFYETPR